MSWLRSLVFRFRSLVDRRRLDEELDEELRFCLQMETDANIRRGMSTEKAKRAARLKLGGEDSIKEACRDERGFPLLESFVKDLRCGMRSMLQSPIFALAIISTFALGIGGTTAMYSFVSGILLTPLPYFEAESLVDITRNNKARDLENMPVWSRQLAAFREQSRVLSRLSALEYDTMDLSGDEGAERVFAARILPDLLPLLGIDAALGRGFLPEEFHLDKGAPVILSHRLWQRRFGGDADIAGRAIMVDGEQSIVIGVLPERVDLPPRVVVGIMEVDLVAPIGVEALHREPVRYWRVLARLEPGVSIEVAREEVNAIMRRLEQEDPPPVTGWGGDVTPLKQTMVGKVEPMLFLLLGAVVLVLLIACANVANLLLVRGVERERELAIRAAIGAGRRRIVRQLLTESTLLSLLGGSAGMLLALGGTKLLLKLTPSNIPRLEEVGVDSRVLFFAVATSLATGLVTGILPALGVSRINLDRTLKAAGLTITSAAHRHRLRNLLTVSEMALALTLLVGAGLILQSFLRLLTVDPGFDAGSLLTMRISLPEYRYTDTAQRSVAIREILQRVEALPEVQSAAGSPMTPMTGSYGRAQVSIEHSGGSVQERSRWLMVFGVTHGFFRTMGIPLYEGSDFSEESRPKIPGTVIINQALARSAWPGENPLGKRLKFGGPSSTYPWLTAGGVVGDARLVGLATAAEDVMFMPYLHGERVSSGFQMIVRTGSDPVSAAPSVRSAVWQIDERLPVDQIRTMEQLLSREVSWPRFNMVVIGLFASAAIALAGIGTFGIVSHSGARRSHEIALRMALGASRSGVLKLVMGQGIGLVLLGVATGLAVAYGGTRLLTTFLFEVSATDGTTFLAASLVVGGTGLLATFIPAWKTTCIDPMTTLRAE